MQDSTSPSPSLPTTPSVRSSVSLSAKLPYPKRSNATISDAQRKALRIFASDTRPKPTQKACAAWFQEKFGRIIDRATVSRTLSSQYNYLDNGEAGTRSRKSTAHWPLLDEALFQWQQRHTEKGFPMTGPLIRLKAAEYWKKIPMYKDQTMPAFSDGWLSGFKRRYSIRRHTFQGEAASVPDSIHHEMKAIQIICDEYAPEDIYNMDETGLYWRRMPNGGLASEGRPGQKRDKTRITIAVASNATGLDRLPLWIIGTAKTPHALRGVNMVSIGCKWRYNKKAWMRHEIMEQWLRTFYLRIGRQRRPLDQGIIQNLKHYYRKSWMYWMIGMLDRGIDPRERMSLNYTLRWLTQAWRTKVSNETIQNCFTKSTVVPGCRPSNQDQIKSNLLDPELKPLYNQVVEKLVFQPDADEILPFNEFLNPLDENIDTAEPELDDIILNFGGEDIDDDLPDPDEEYIFGPRPEIPSDTVILRHLSDLSLWAAHREGCTEENMLSIEALTKAFKKLEVDGKRQKTLMEMGFKPK
ncbi:hypothetical protein N7481_010291 [Penicillium waksmanii]|uniref:uncharacterized protein n=1 Tax=Penicillium waksmanii TaxID=69791 RepID=UPI0025477D8F|nr:uncharacterized protein N7481_010291 [Penicillium waksmanii]KAJ5976584.1 hypothetical protein N7481_010291 [Penicillium waksmanii]